MPRSVMISQPERFVAMRVGLSAGALLSALAAWQFQEQITAEGLIVTSTNFRLALYAIYVLAALLGAFAIAAYTSLAPRMLNAAEQIRARWRLPGMAAWVAIAILLLAYPVIVLGFYGVFLTNLFPRLLLFAIFVVISVTLLALANKRAWLANFATSSLVFAGVYLAAAFFNMVTNFPFSLEWSEISRYYQASLFFGQQVYGVNLPLPVTHPSRYMLQSLPFLIPESTLWLHRFWQALLWVAMPLAAAWALARRLRFKDETWRRLFVVWGFLFLMQGAVFYHLLPCVILVLLGFDKHKLWRSLLFVALASVWAGLSRVNWIPMPGGLAALLYLLEVAPRPRQSVLSVRYLWQPALFAIGGSAIAAVAYWVYIVNSGNPIEQFGSSFTSDLLWERLWPNAAFPLGILPGVVLVCAPLAFAAALRLRRNGEGFDFWRGVAIAGMLVVFFAGGLIVSVKIGGGTNLHNMDAFMVLLWVLGSTLLFGDYAPAGRTDKANKPLKLPAALIAAAVAIPVLFAVLVGSPLQLPDEQATRTVLAEIQMQADRTIANNMEVLFISQRHLLTFDLVHDVPLMPRYEKLFLMEMAISGNDEYLAQFARDIDEQRFGLIVSDPLYNNIVDTSEDTLAAENNAWVRAVGRAILCAYVPVATYSNPPVQLLAPRYNDKCNQ